MKMAHSRMTKAAIHAAIIGTMGYEPANTQTHARSHIRERERERL